MASSTAVTEDYRCGYCWQEFLSMEDPRELPCGHVFCITCLEADNEEKKGVLDCQYCQKECRVLNLGDLKKAKLANHPDAPPRTTSTCDNAHCGDNLAVSFCVECSNKYCDTHEETHNQHFGEDTHRVIAIAIYDESPDNFQKPICKKHKNVERMKSACQVCDKMVCDECDKYDDECKDGKRHVFLPFNDLDDGLVAHYSDLLKDADTKLAEICKLEKGTWHALDEDDIIRKNLLTNAERDRDAAIVHAKELYEKVVARVQYDQVEPTQRIESFNHKLTEKREAMDAMRLRTRRLMRDGSVTEKIRQRKEITDQLKAHVDEPLNRCNIEPYKLPPVEDILFQHKANVIDPEKVKIIGCDIATTKTCYDVEYVPSGLILSAGNRSFDLCNRTGKVVRTVFCREGDFTSLQHYKGKIYCLMKQPKGSSSRRVMVFSAETYQETTRWKLPDYGYVSMLAVSNDKVYVVDNKARQVKVYKLDGEHVTDISHPEFKNPVYMCPHSADGVLISDWSANLVYKINSVSDQVEWSFRVLSPRGVYCDKLANIWVWSSKEKSIYLRSSDGKKMKVLSNDKLKETGIEYICGFTLVEGKLWGAACGRGIVRVEIDVSDS